VILHLYRRVSNLRLPLSRSLADNYRGGNTTSQPYTYVNMASLRQYRPVNYNTFLDKDYPPSSANNSQSQRFKNVSSVVDSRQTQSSPPRIPDRKKPASSALDRSLGLPQQPNPPPQSQIQTGTIKTKYRGIDTLPSSPPSKRKRPDLMTEQSSFSKGR